MKKIFLVLSIVGIILSTFSFSTTKVMAGVCEDELNDCNASQLGGSTCSNQYQQCLQDEKQVDSLYLNGCEKWSQSDQARNSGKICTELVEGIPCFTLTGGKCTSENCAQPPSDVQNGICKSVITASGLTGIQFYVAMIYTYASWVIGITAVLVLIFSGLEIALGGANAEGVGKAKKRIYQALAGIAFFYLIGMILKAINPNFFQ